MATYDCDTTQEAANSSTVNDSADIKNPKTFMTLCDDLAIASFTYRQLQECAKQYGIPCNLKKQLLAELLSARLKGRVDYVNNKIEEVRFRRMKIRQLSKCKKKSNEHDYSALKEILSLKREPASSYGVEDQARTSRIKHGRLQRESSSHLLLKHMVKKCSARNVTITQTQSHTSIQMRPSLLDSCVQFMSQGAPVPPDHKLPFLNSKRLGLPMQYPSGAMVTAYPSTPVAPPYSSGPLAPYSSNLMQDNCSSNLFANSSDYLPSFNYKPVMQQSFNDQRSPQMNFPSRNLQVAETSTVSMNGNVMHFYNTKTSDYPKPEEQKMVYNLPCPVEMLGLPHISNSRQYPYMHPQPLQWNMNSYQNYQHGYEIPIQDIERLENQFGIKSSLPFMDTMVKYSSEQSSPAQIPYEESLNHIYQEPETVVEPQVLPNIDSILPRRLYHEHQYAPSSTFVSDLACLAETATNNKLHDSNNLVRSLTEHMSDKSQMFLQPETINGNVMEIPTWTKFLEQNPQLSTPSKVLCRYRCTEFLKSEVERLTHEEQCSRQIVNCPKPGCTWRNQLASLSTHIFNSHYLEIFNGDATNHHFNLDEAEYNNEGPLRFCFFQHAGRRLFVINALFNFLTKEIFICIQFVNDLNKSISTAVLEVMTNDGTPLQWCERVGPYNANTLFPRSSASRNTIVWDGQIPPLSTPVTELTAKRNCLIMSTDQMVTQHEFNLYVVVRPHHLRP